jgi:hypothetical protein
MYKQLYSDDKLVLYIQIHLLIIISKHFVNNNKKKKNHYNLNIAILSNYSSK